MRQTVPHPPPNRVSARSTRAARQHASAGTGPAPRLGFGAGAESRRPLGLAVVGGLLVSQTLTLYLTPVFYTYMESLSGLLSRRRAVGVAFERPSEGANAGARAPR